MHGSRTSGSRRAARRLLAIAALTVGAIAGTTVSASAAVTATFSAGTLSVSGDSLNNSITVSRDAAGKILVNGGAVTVAGGTPTVANTALIQVFGLGGQDVITLSEVNGALPKANLFGGAGNDVLTGGSGGDQLFGQTGNDTLLGKGGVDLLFGGNENDTMTGGDADDQAFGQSGNDRMIWNPGDDTDLNEGGAGTDTRRGQRRQRRRAVHRHGQRHPGPLRPRHAGAVRDRHRHVREARPQRQRRRRQLLRDREPGRAHRASPSTAAPATTRSSAATEPTVRLGGDGNDFADGQQGNDLALLGAGDDTFQWDPGDGSDVIEGQDGIDTMAFNGSNIGREDGRLRQRRACAVHP